MQKMDLQLIACLITCSLQVRNFSVSLLYEIANLVLEIFLVDFDVVTSEDDLISVATE